MAVTPGADRDQPPTDGDLGRARTTVRHVAPRPRGTDGDQTLTMPEGERHLLAADDPDRFPVPGWERYQGIRLLGQGGMGRVFLARDLTLHRNVAIKFVRGDDPDDARRVIAEARAQARINDERVCKVYDVGQIEGRVYIAMQHIDGKTLSDLVDELTIEQKALVVRGAALAVAEAHRVGLIHRDIKPSNIMVERGADGTLHPYVMDFGLARDWRTSDTMTGTVLGTPQFMAPEQARGEVKRLDRRADIYSLGATLYALITDRAPVEGINALEILSKVSHVEPARPRSIVGDLPLELEAIVLKCLEKERDRRYDSARALADDLDRFLAGEPVAARVLGHGYRLRRWARRHARALALAAAVTVAVGGALGFAWRERQAAAHRAELASRFATQSESIEAIARYAALAPLHDLAPDRARIRAAMAGLEHDIAAEGDDAIGPGHFALGRGYLALGDDARAADELRAAHAAGVDDPRAAYALAVAEGHLYQRELRAAELLPEAMRAPRRAEAAARHREPALAALRGAGTVDGPAGAYVAALIAYYEGRFTDALAALDAIGARADREPWFYEAPLLRGEILRARATAPETPADARDADLRASRDAFAAAAAIGESDPAVHQAQGELEDLALTREVYGGGNVDGPYARGRDAAGRVLTMVPGDPDALVLRARLTRRLAEHRGNRGEDAIGELTRAAADARQALTRAPARDDLRLALAQVYLQWGEYRQGRNEDPGDVLTQAIAQTDAIAPASRDANYYIHVGIIHTVWADYQDQNGRPSARDRGLAIDAYQAAIAKDPRVASAWLNLGKNYAQRASHGADADGDLARAIAALERGRALDPGNLAAAFFEGDAYASVAQRARDRGDDPAPAAARAADAYTRGLAANPGVPLLLNGLAMTRTSQAEDAWSRGEAPEPYTALAIAAATQAIVAAPDQAFGYANLGDALARRARWLWLRGGDGVPAITGAIDALVTACARLSDDPLMTSYLASAYAVRAELRRRRGLGGHDDLARARTVADTALRLGPDLAVVHTSRAEVAEAEARAEAAQRRAPDSALASARAEFARAAALEPDRAALAIGQVALERRAIALVRRDPTATRAALNAGRALAEQARGRWPQVASLRALAAWFDVELGRLPGASDDAVRRGRDAEPVLRALATQLPGELGAWRVEDAGDRP